MTTAAQMRRYVRRLRRAEAEMGRRTALSSPLSFCPHAPHPKQAEFLALDCLEAMYGGAAAGGKSDALLMAALQYVHVPGYAAILFRRTYKDLSLPEAIMNRAEGWFRGTLARWSEDKKTWTFPSGATITFGYLDHENDKFRYQSAEFQFIGFDELTQFSESQYRYMFSRLRRSRALPVPLRMRGATNPGGVGHAWVFDRFVRAGWDEMARRYTRPPGPPRDREFVPSRLDDNPHVDAESYERALAELDETERKQLRSGDWVLDASALMYRMPRLISALPASPQWTRVLSLDFGVTDDTSFSVCAWRPHDTTLYVESSYKEAGLAPSEAADRALAITRRVPIETIIGDIGGLGKGFAREMEVRYSLPVTAAEKSDKRGYVKLYNGDVSNGRVAVVEGTCQDYIAELKVHRWADAARIRESTSTPNHCCDGVLYGWRHSRNYIEREVAPAITEQEAIAQEEARMEREAELQYEASRRSPGRHRMR